LILCDWSSLSSTMSQMWKLTGIELHAAKAIEIMDAWSGTLKSVDPNCELLLATRIRAAHSSCRQTLTCSLRPLSDHP
jgi:hypothetical protein